MSNKITFDDIFSQFLTYVHSCTFASLTEEEIEGELKKLLIRALAAFLFPQCSLDYAVENVDNELIYYFTDEKFGQQEINVLLVYMQQFFIEWLLIREKNFERQYYDADTKTHSQGNLIQQLNTAYKTIITQAIKTNYNYARMDTNKRSPRIGFVNE